jgi:MFS family permease
VTNVDPGRTNLVYEESVAAQGDVQRRTVWTLSLSQMLGGVAVAGAVAAGGLIAAGVSGSEAFAGLAQTFGVLGAALFALPLARLALTRGRRVSLAAGYVLGACGAALVVLGAVTRVLALVLVGCLLVGVATATGFQARYAATDLAPADRRGRALSYVVWATTIGSVIGPNLLGISGNLGLALGLPQLAGPYVVAIVALALAAAVLLVNLRPDPYLLARELQWAAQGSVRGPAQGSAQGSGAAPVPPRTPRLRDGLAHLRQHPVAILGVATIAVGHVAMVMVMVMTPIHMAHVDVQLQLIGLVISVHVAGMYALSPVVGYAVDRIGRFPVIVTGVGILVAACAVSAVAAADDVVVLGIGLFLLGLGWSCTLIAGSTLVTDAVGEDERPAVQGLSDLVMNASGALGGAVAGVVVYVTSYSVLCAVAVVPVVGLLIAVSIPACRRRSNTRSR